MTMAIHDFRHTLLQLNSKRGLYKRCRKPVLNRVQTGLTVVTCCAGCRSTPHTGRCRLLHAPTVSSTPIRVSAMALTGFPDTPGADPGFWERGSLINIFTTGGGPVTARASRGALIAPSVWSGAKPQPLFLLLRLFSMKFTVISKHTSCDIRITRACMMATRKLFILHNAIVPTAQQLNS